MLQFTVHIAFSTIVIKTYLESAGQCTLYSTILDNSLTNFLKYVLITLTSIYMFIITFT